MCQNVPRKLLHFFRQILIAAIATIIIWMLLVFAIENKMIYFPAKYPEGNWQPMETYGVKAEDCYFKTEDSVQLHGWFVHSDSSAVTMLWCDGNAGNITHRLDNIKRLLDLKINIFIFDYRGYGRSEGEPDEEGLYLDAKAAYGYLLTRKEIDPEKIVFFGRSLGTAVAVDLALHRKCIGLILESAFTTAKDMAKEIMPFIPAHLIIKSKFDSFSKIKNIHVPLLVIHGNEDDTIPFELGKKLFEAANEPKYFYEIPGASHNDTYGVGGSEYFRRIGEFLKSISNK